MNLLGHVWNRCPAGIPGAFWLALLALSRRIANALTTWAVRRNVGKAGKHVTVFRGIYYQNPGHIHIGNDVFISTNALFTTESTEGRLEICDGVNLTENCHIDFSGGVRIGEKCLISKNVTIETHDHGLDPRSNPECHPLSIGKNVWLGMHSLILANVRTIGDNAIVAAGSVVTRPVPDNCIVAGVPARVIKTIPSAE